MDEVTCKPLWKIGISSLQTLAEKYGEPVAWEIAPELGNEVIWFGYEEIADVWSEYVSKKINVPVVVLCDGFIPWWGNAIQCKGRFLV